LYWWYTAALVTPMVYHQYKAKEEIVIAAVTSELVVLEQALDAAEAQEDLAIARQTLLEQVVDLMVARRYRAGHLQGDPVMIRMLAVHKPYRRLMDRLYRLLTGEAGPGARVQAAMLTSSLGAAVTHPLVMDLDDDELRGQLLHFAGRLLP
jgi:AcrR family transcriptional regulator